jgi:hypothetical protein
MKDPKILPFGSWFKVYEQAGRSFKKSQQILESRSYRGMQRINEGEGAAYVREMDANEKAAVALLKDNKTAAGFTGYGTILQFLKTNAIYFNFSQEKAADWILLGYIRLYAGTNWLKKPKIDGKWVDKVKSDLKKWGDIVNEISKKIETNMADDTVSWNEYQFNQSPEDSNNINTLGKITAGGLDPNQGQYPSNSNLEEICRYVNTYNLVNNILVGWETSTGYEYGMPDIIEEKGKTQGYLDFKGGTFIDNSAAKESFQKNPTVGNREAQDIYFWSLKGYTPPSSKTKSTTTKPDPIKQVGDVIEPSPIDAGYKALYYKPSDEALNKLLETLNKVKEIGEIVELTVYGSASTERIDMGTANQGKEGQALINYWKEKGQPGADKFVPAAANLNGTKLPADKVINGSGVAGIVTDPMASGNAFLAKLRCDEIANFLSANQFTPAKRVYQITQGTDDARFIKVSFKVKKPDETTTLDPKVVLQTVSSVGSVKDYGAVFKCKVADIDLW